VAATTVVITGDSSSMLVTTREMSTIDPTGKIVLVPEAPAKDWPDSLNIAMDSATVVTDQNDARLFWGGRDTRCAGRLMFPVSCMTLLGPYSENHSSWTPVKEPEGEVF